MPKYIGNKAKIFVIKHSLTILRPLAQISIFEGSGGRYSTIEAWGRGDAKIPENQPNILTLIVALLLKWRSFEMEKI